MKLELDHPSQYRAGAERAPLDTPGRCSSAYGARSHRDWRPGPMRLLLLHLYSHLRNQVAFEALAELVWP